MKKILTQYGVCALASITAVSVTPSQAQVPAQSVQAALSQEAGTLSKKFTGLAQVMAGKYEWKPGQGVRSVGDVFNLIVEENGLLADALTGKTNRRAEPAPITDPGKMQDALKAQGDGRRRCDNDPSHPTQPGNRRAGRQAIGRLFGPQDFALGFADAIVNS